MERDTIRKRATFDLPYPKVQLYFTREDKVYKFKNKTEKLVDTDVKTYVKAKRLHFEIDNSSFRDIVFTECSFHNKGGTTNAMIDRITFERCHFIKNIMGSTLYLRVEFKHCKFERCDFMNSDFKECLFIDCEFKECTAYRTRFIETLIDPVAFIKSIQVPNYNLSASSNDEKILIEREWKRLILFSATQLFLSNKAISNSDYTDSSLVELKKAENNLLKDEILYGKNIEIAQKKSFWNIFLKNKKDSLYYFFNWLNLCLTNGGTSFYKLMNILLILVPIISFKMGFLNIKYHETKIQYPNTDTIFTYGNFERFIDNIPHALGIFLGLEYSEYQASCSNEYWVLLILHC
jgi:uncharacterized protein YjbI with pentapeptide repeats